MVLERWTLVCATEGSTTLKLLLVEVDSDELAKVHDDGAWTD
jgi:hypothetical protein